MPRIPYSSYTGSSHRSSFSKTPVVVSGKHPVSSFRQKCCHNSIAHPVYQALETQHREIEAQKRKK